MSTARFRNPYEGHKAFDDEDLRSSVKELFERRVLEYPDKPALECEDISYSYSEINRVVNAVAHEILDTLGEGPGEVLIWLEDSLPAVTSIMAIWKAGKAVTAIDPSAPFDYNKGILTASLPDLVILQQAYLPQLMPCAPESTRLLVWEALDLSLNQQNPGNVVPQDRVLNITYTSGSRGAPKGVLYTQGNEIWHKVVYANTRGNRPSDKVLHMSPLSHANGPSLIMGCFLLGCTISYYPLNKLGIEALPDWISSRRITRMSAVSTLFRYLLRGTRNKPDLSSVSHLHLGGEQIRPDDIQLYKENFPDDCVLLCNIGSTEAGAFSRFYVTKDTEIGTVVPLGRPYPGITIHLWDENNNAVPSGEPGTIVIESEHLASGYKGLPELTARTFLKVSGQANLRRFITGDLGKWDENGNLIFLGREDQQIKVHGHRVEIGYIESTLQRHPSVHGVAVKNWPDDQSGSFLAAYLVPEPGYHLDTGQLRQWLSERLPSYMIPVSFTVMESLPLTGSHKVDRKNLPPPRQADEPDPPGNAIERSLHEIWKGLFPDKKVNCDDNFFALGGDSLLVTRLIAQIRDQYQIDVPINLIFEAPTIRDMADNIASNMHLSGNIIPLAKGNKLPPIFMVHGWAGSVFHFMELAQRLNTSQPIFGIQGNEHSGNRTRQTSVEALGQDYARQIMNTVPEGPIYLMGYSLGGMVALETCRQLELLGRRATHLLVVDSTPKNLPAGVRYRMVLPYLWSRLKSNAGDIITRRNYLQWTYIANRWRTLLILMGIRKPPVSVAHLTEEEVIVPDGADYYQVISQSYVARPLDIPVTLFISDQTRSDLKTAWSYIAKNKVTTYTIPGQHLEVLNAENINEFLQVFKKAIQAINSSLKDNLSTNADHR